MNRYKFRAWLKSYKEIVQVDLLGKNKILSSRTWLDIKDIELMQNPGLQDKNGVEINEGDIVKCEQNNSTYSLKIGVAEFNDTDLGSCGCCFDEFFGAGFVIKTVKTKNDDGKYFSLYDLEKSVVIGNIYKNKELLEDE